MKTEFYWASRLALLLLLAMNSAYAHVRLLHERITIHAESSAFNNSPRYGGFLEQIAFDCDREGAAHFMAEGSKHEDDTYSDEGGFRVYNHFYDPLTDEGLSNYPLDDRVSPIGRSSFVWGSLFNSPGRNFYGLLPNINSNNRWSWQNARDHEWHGLTDADPDDRREALTNMFRAIGQVIHLLEDCSQPQHTRNEQHVPLGWKSPIETYGNEQLDALNYQPGFLDWRGAGFTRMQDFWDRNLYNGNSSQALDNDATGAERVGMAEFSNGNFLGARHLYPEYFKPGAVERYPFPSRDHSTDYNQVRANPALGLRTFNLGNNQEGRGIYITKVADGARGYSLSRINYLGARRFRGLKAKAFCTIDDPNVLAEYHNRLIPRAIEYSAGLIDYFFRGRITATAAGRTITIRNESGEAFGAGGIFTVLSDVEGVRDTVDSLELTQPLPHNETANITLPGTVPAGTRCIIVYRGTIGLNAQSAASDPVDEDIAIAATRVTLRCDVGMDAEYLATATIETVDAGEQFESFGTFPEGTYVVRYLEGALSFAGGVDMWTGINSLSRAPAITVLHNGGEAVFDETGEFESLEDAEAYFTGARVCFDHGGGTIQLHFTDDPYGDNDNGERNPTFELYRLTPTP